MFTTGFGLAAAYIEDHLHAWGVKPAGDHGLLPADGAGARREGHQPLDGHRRGRRRRRARSQTATAITFPKNAGGKRRFTLDRVEFAGYGLDAPAPATWIFAART